MAMVWPQSVDHWGSALAPSGAGMKLPHVVLRRGAAVSASLGDWRQCSGAETSVVCPQTLDELNDDYTVRDAAATRAFIEAHPHLLPLLHEAVLEIARYFPESERYLRVVTDPEVPGDEQILLTIATRQEPSEAGSLLDQFDERWWLGAMDRADGLLCIDLEFR